MLTQAQRQELSQKYEHIKQLAAGREQQLFQVMDACSEDEAICMQYLYAHMPISDLANYDGELFLKFVKHALKVRAMVPWGQDMDDEVFLNYVLQYRINNENVEFYSEAFFDELFPRINGLDLYKAIISVNYWCFEKATYQSTDIRTASPFTVLKNAYGRCGEESTLAVAALRSVGIPARQIYAPRWTHCDDNHAWVEVFINGKWMYLGACEPEQRLNTGWFRLPSSKGMHIHTRAFSNLVSDEKITDQTSRHTEISVLGHYAESKDITVQVVNTSGQPLPNVHVRFEIVNYAELFPLAELMTNAAGEATFTTGLGDLVIFVHDDVHYVYDHMNTRITDTIQLVLGETSSDALADADLTLAPPAGGVEEEAPLTEEEEKAHAVRYAASEQVRKAYEATFYNEERAAAYASQYPIKQSEIAELLVKARGNYAELIYFLEDQATAEHLELKVTLLQTLNKKDLTDMTKKVLIDHLLGALPYRADMDPAIYEAYVLCPRVAHEVLTPYRSAIVQHFTEQQLQDFKADPQAIYAYLDTAIQLQDEMEHSTLSASPAGLLELRAGSAYSKDICCVSIMRTLGIPAKIEKADGVVEYYVHGAWHTVPERADGLPLRTARLILKKPSNVIFDYYRNLSVAVLEGAQYKTLNYEDCKWDGDQITFAVTPGHYRVITADRQADGTLTNKLYIVDIAEHEQKELEIELAQSAAQPRAVAVTDRMVRTQDGQSVQLSELLAPHSNIVAWLDVSAEPTEHLLNEIMEAEDKFNTMKPTTVLILSKAEDMNDPTLSKAIKHVPHMKLVVSDEDITALDPLYAGFEITDKKLPLAIVVEEELTGTYAWSGYNVGIGDMLLKHLSMSRRG